MFPDKAALLRAVAAEAINPATGRAEFDAILAGTTDLHERVLRVAEHLMGRMQEAMKVMFAVRAHLIAAAGKDGPLPTGPPSFIVDANRELLERSPASSRSTATSCGSRRRPPPSCCAASSSAPATRACSWPPT